MVAKFYLIVEHTDTYGVEITAMTAEEIRKHAKSPLGIGKRFFAVIDGFLLKDFDNDDLSMLR